MPTRSLIRFLLAGVMIFAVSLVPVAAMECDPLPQRYQPVRSALDGLHREVLDFLDENNANTGLFIEPNPRAGLDLYKARQLLARYLESVQAFSSGSDRDGFAIRLFDLVRLLSIMGPEHGLPTQDYANLVAELLDGTGTSLQAFDLGVLLQINKELDAATTRRLVARHQTLFGPQTRQWLIFGRTGQNAEQQDYETFGDNAAIADLNTRRMDRIAFARSIGNRHMEMEAIVDWLAGEKFRQAPMDEILRSLRELLPDIEERAREDLLDLIPFYENRTNDLPCLRVSKRTTGFTLDTILELGDREERSRVLEFGVMHSLDPSMFATESYFAMVSANRLMQLRLVYPEIYREAIGYVDCSASREPNTACVEETMADVYETLNRGAVALQFQQSAFEEYVRTGADADIVANAKFRLGRLEWQFGSTGTAIDLISSVTTGPKLNFAAPSTDDLPRYYLTMMGIFEAQQDDASIQALLVEVLKIREAALAENIGGGAAALDPTPFVVDHFRGLICPNCSAALTAPILSWMDEEARGARWGGILAMRLAPDALIGEGERNRLTRQYLAGMASRVTQASLSQIAALRSTPMTEQELAVVVALAAAHPNSEEEMNAQWYVDFAAFLFERDLDRKRALYVDLTENYYSTLLDFGAEQEYARLIGQLADMTRMIGYSLSSRVLDEHLLRLHRERIDNFEQESSRRQARTESAETAVPLLARLSRALIEEGMISHAGTLLAEASDLALLSLAQTWEAGDERALLRYRQLAPALRLIAQQYVQISQERPTQIYDNETFAALQMAMLGETALTSRAAQRRQLLTLPRARTVLDAFVSARKEATLFAYYQDEVGIRDTEWEQQEQRRLGAELVAARVALEQVLPDANAALALTPVDLWEAQRTLASDELLVILHAGSDGIYGMLAEQTGDGYSWRSEVAQADYVKAITELRVAIEGDGKASPNYPFELAHALYRTIFGPAADRVTRARKLYLLVDGPLLALPFAVLPTSLPSPVPQTFEDFRSFGIPWLGTTHSLVYLPTVNALSIVDEHTNPPTSLPFAGIGDPVLAGSAATAVGFDALYAGGDFVPAGALDGLVRLPGTRTELMAMAQASQARLEDVLVGPDATETKLRQLPLQSYRVIAFATHGLLAGEIGDIGEPGLVLTPPASPSIADDGYLGLSEVMQLELQADLVILSACNTAGPDGSPRADGLSGLARGFMTAGAGSIAVTHWSISSDATVSLNSEWFRQKAANADMTWADAMQAAMRAMVKELGPAEYAHPRNWGPFALFGAERVNSPVPTESTAQPTPPPHSPPQLDDTNLTVVGMTTAMRQTQNNAEIQLEQSTTLLELLVGQGVADSIAAATLRPLRNLLPSEDIPAGFKVVLVMSTQANGTRLPLRVSIYAPDAATISWMHVATVALSDGGAYVTGIDPATAELGAMERFGRGKQSRYSR